MTGSEHVWIRSLISSLPESTLKTVRRTASRTQDGITARANCGLRGFVDFLSHVPRRMRCGRQVRRHRGSVSRDFLVAGTVCRESAGGCDVVEACDGATDVCLTAWWELTGVECRAAVGDCDVAETCDGSSNARPSNSVAAAGARRQSLTARVWVNATTNSALWCLASLDAGAWSGAHLGARTARKRALESADRLRRSRRLHPAASSQPTDKTSGADEGVEIRRAKAEVAAE